MTNRNDANASNYLAGLTNFLFVAVLFSLLSSPCRAEIRWKNDNIEAKANFSDTGMMIQYPFINESDSVVTFKSVTPSCGCTKTRLDKTVYQPHETGVIVAQFTFESLKGWDQKYITVVTDVTSKTTYILNFRVFIPRFDISPPSLVWATGTDRNQKKVHISVMCDSPIQITGVRDPNGLFQLQLTQISAGRSYDLFVTPPDTSVNAGSDLLIETDAPSGIPRVFKLSVQAQ